MRAKDVCEVGLTQVVLFHEEPESCMWFKIRQLSIAFFVVLDEERHDVEQPHQRMRLSVTDFIDELVQEIDHCSIMALGFDRTEHDWRTALKGAPSWSK